MKRLLTLATILVAAGWGIYLLAGRALADLCAARLGGFVVKLGEGKISSPAEFFQHRMFEAAWLATLLLLWVFLHVILARARWQCIASSRWAWVAHSLLALLCLNLWLGQANRTVLFWGLMWDGAETQNLARFRIKLILTREDRSARHAILMGSSQSRAQIDEELLNSLLGTKLRTTEMHYPGSKAYDHLLLQPILSPARAEYIIVYLSEADFHSGSVSEAVPNFFTFGALPDLVKRGGTKFVPAGGVGYGLLGQVLPMFQMREVLGQRLLGYSIGQLKQRRYNAALQTNLVERGASLSKIYESNEESRFQKRALEDFLIRCRDSNQRVILLAGQLNPVMARRLDPEIRREMMELLRACAVKFPNVTVLENLPGQTEADYTDMTHVNKPAQDRFTRFLAGWLDAHLAASPEKPR